MELQFKDTFVKRLNKQLEFIAKDSYNRAVKFKVELLAKINRIPSNPYIYRKSIFYKNENIRDLVYKGYIVVFRIKNDRIEIFGFVKYQKNPY